ncbi:hypothetical protein [Kocuria sp. CPCC 205263]|uniref:hypothetical protein n=1 Tax=Kocuria sp. CPCC 205263 TaxID=3073555 RepID=UPI0034D49004
MTDSPVVHVQQEQTADLFWRGATVVGLFFVAVVVAVLVGTPVLLMVEFWNPWLLFTLVFAAAGVLLLVKTVVAVRRMAWHARHRSSYVLREAAIETTEWNTVGAEAPVRRVIPLEAMASVVASYRILRRIILTENGGGTLTETAPVLHILFDQDGSRRIVSVPFSSHRDPAIDARIAALRKHGVELGYTARALSWKGEAYLGPEAQLEYLATTEEVIPFPATGGWLDNTIRLENQWHQNATRVQEQAERRDPALREARQRPTGRHWILGAWFAGMYALGAGFLLPYLVQHGWLPAAVRPLEILVVLRAAALFFLPLRRGLRWFHGLVCWLLLVVISFSVLVGSVEMGPAAERTAMIGFGLTVLSAALLWAPYLLVKRSVPRHELVRGSV